MKGFFKFMNCTKVQRPRPHPSSPIFTAQSPEPPEIQSVYEVESLRHLSIKGLERDPLGSWHSDLFTILRDYGKDPRDIRTVRSAANAGAADDDDDYYYYYSTDEHDDRTMSTHHASLSGHGHPAAASTAAGPLITGLHHINLTVPHDTLDLAKRFYADTLGLTLRPVPAAQVHELVWLDIGASGQQVHISLPKHDGDTAPLDASRHPCFRVGSPAALLALQKRIYGHWLRGGDDAPLAADKVGETSGPTTHEYPQRFFARDFAGNRLEFTV